MSFSVYLVASLIISIDRLTKFIAYKNLFEGQSIKILPGVFHITLVLNKGVAFGLFKDQEAYFTMLSIITIFFIAVYTLKLKEKKGASFKGIALGMILGGAIGNLIDRIRFGYVIDFLDFRVWPVFNIADSCITIGAVILVWLLCTPSS